MRKGTGVFTKVEQQKTICDECKQDVDSVNYIHIDAHWSDGYDYYVDNYDLCSLDCMLKHMEKEHLPPENEDIKLEIPVSMFRVILSKLSD